MTAAYNVLFQAVLVILGVLLCACLVRAIMGPRIADRIIAVNMMGTIVVIIICVLGVMMHEGYLTDVAIIYAMLSFLAVVLLSKLYIGSYHDKRRQGKDVSKEGTGDD